jgi:hypothetical protein
MQVVLFISLFVAEMAASFALFRIDPMNPVCVVYPSVWAYVTGHLMTSALILLAIATGWWLAGNMAEWESICRTRQRSKVLVQAGLYGLGIDLVSSLISRYIASLNDGPHPVAQESILPWLVLRGGLWSGAYYAMGTVFLCVLQLKLRSRRLAADPSR